MASHSTYLTATSHQLCAINEITDRSPRLMDEYSLSSLLQLSKASFYLAQFFRPFFNVRIDIASKGAIPTRLDFERRLKRWLVRLYNRGGGKEIAGELRVVGYFSSNQVYKRNRRYSCKRLKTANRANRNLFGILEKNEIYLRYI